MTTNTTDRLFLIYCGIVAFQYHPGNKTPLTPNECISQALKHHNKFEEVLTWLGSEQQSQSAALSSVMSLRPQTKEAQTTPTNSSTSKT